MCSRKSRLRPSAAWDRWHVTQRRRVRYTVGMLLLGVVFSTGCSEQSDVSFVVIVKSSNYAQDHEERLTLLNYHFFSEIFLRPGGALTGATLARAAAPLNQMEYESRGDNFYFEGGHFDSQEDADRGHPNGLYVVSIEAPAE